MIKSMDFIGEDSRVRKYILPKKILHKTGEISGISELFIKKDVQITTNEARCFTMENNGCENASVLLDFGVELVGSLKLLTYHAISDEAVKVRLCFGESASEALSNIGVNNATNDHSSRDFVVDIVNLSDMEFGATGFRFVNITLLNKTAKISFKSILAVFTYRDIAYKGSFECDNNRLNEIFDRCAYTCHLNMQNMLWDGIKRDRLVWIGDMHPEMLTIKTVFGYDKCIEQGLEFSAKQFSLPRFANDMVTYSMWWIIIASEWYFYSGNSDFINKHKSYIKDLLQTLLTFVNEDGSDNLSSLDEAGSHMGYFLDWPTLGSPDTVFGVRALFSMALVQGGKLGKLLGYELIENQCNTAASLLAKPPIPDVKLKACISFMSLAGHIDSVSAANKLVENGAHGFSTFMSYYILTALAKGGKLQEGLDLLLEYYGAMLDMGATTFFEDFDISWKKEDAHLTNLCLNGEYNFHGETGAYCYKGLRHSLCHGWSSAPTAFIVENILGIRVLEAGCKKVEIKPNLLNLKYAKGSFETPYGKISVDCFFNENGELITKIDAPSEIIICLE